MPKNPERCEILVALPPISHYIKRHKNIPSLVGRPPVARAGVGSLGIKDILIKN
jgi:hypothetical protein